MGRIQPYGWCYFLFFHLIDHCNKVLSFIVLSNRTKDTFKDFKVKTKLTIRVALKQCLKIDKRESGCD